MSDLPNSTHTAYVLLGTNFRPITHIEQAIQQLESCGRIVKKSRIYQTPPQNWASSQWFWNQAIAIEVTLSPEAVKSDILQPIEDKLGRIRNGARCGNVPIDLDLLLYDRLAIETDTLTLPNPKIIDCPHMSIPLSDIAPAHLMPSVGKRVFDIAVMHRLRMPAAHCRIELTPELVI